MIADVLTKRLCKNKLLRFRHMLGMRPSTCNAACRKEWWRKALLQLSYHITCRVINIILRYHNFSCIMWSTWFLVIWMIKLFLVLHSSILVRAVTNSTIILPIILTLKKENTITEKIQQETMWLQEHIRL